MQFLEGGPAPEPYPKSFKHNDKVFLEKVPIRSGGMLRTFPLARV
jgi:hypothetical protein